MTVSSEKFTKTTKVQLPNLFYLSSVAPRPLYSPAMPFSLSNCLVICMAVGDFVSTVPAATVSGISFL